MKKLSASLAVFFSASLLLAQGTEWSTYSSTDGKCEVKFPGKFITKGTKSAMQAILEAQGGKAVYILGFNAFPNDVAIDNKDIVKDLFDKGRDSTLKGFKGSKLLKETDGTTGGFPSRDLEVDAPNLGIYRARFILTSKHFYQVVMLGPKDFVESEDGKKFRDSFKTTHKKPKAD